MGKKKLFPKREKLRKAPPGGVGKEHSTVKHHTARHQNGGIRHWFFPPFLCIFAGRVKSGSKPCDGTLHNFYYSTMPHPDCQGAAGAQKTVRPRPVFGQVAQARAARG